MSRRRGFFIATAVLAGFIALAVLLVSLAPEPERRAPPSRVPFVQTVAVVAGVGSIPVHGAGVVRPVAEVDLAPEVGGRVVWVDPQLQSGHRVRAGEVLFRIDADDYRFQVRQAEAALEARRVEFLKAEEAAAIAADEYERFAAGAGAHAPAATPLALHEPQLKAAGAALRREEAGLRHAQLALYRTDVVAPLDGIVREEWVEAGQLVAPNTSVGRIFSTDAAEVVVPLSDIQASLIPGLWEEAQPDGTGHVAALVHADYGDQRGSWPGFVDRALASVDETTRTIEVVVRVPDPFGAGDLAGAAGTPAHPPLLVGKFAEVVIDGAVSAAYFRLRRAALRPGDEIWCVRPDDTVRIVPVRVLQRIDGEVFVAGALDPNEPAIVGGIRFATDGMAVRTADGERSRQPPTQ